MCNCMLTLYILVALSCYIVDYSRFFRGSDETYKAKLKAIASEKTPFFLGKFEERVKENGGYFVAGKVQFYYFLYKSRS